MQQDGPHEKGLPTAFALRAKVIGPLYLHGSHAELFTMVYGCWLHRPCVPCAKVLLQLPGSGGAKGELWTTGGHQLQAEGVGDVPVLAFNGHQWVKKVLKESYVPGSQYFLMSMAKTLDQGCKAVADSDGVKFTREGEIVAVGQRKGQLFFMLFREWNDGSSGSCTAVSGVLSLQEWHRRLGHQCRGRWSRCLSGAALGTSEDAQSSVKRVWLGRVTCSPFPRGKFERLRSGKMYTWICVDPWSRPWEDHGISCW